VYLTGSVERPIVDPERLTAFYFYTVRLTPEGKEVERPWRSLWGVAFGKIMKKGGLP
jgi:hypothetical protein